MAVIHHKGNDPAEALAFFKANRAELRALRRIIVDGDTTTVVDINGKEMALDGLTLGHQELVELLDLTGASYDPATIHEPSKGKYPAKMWEIVKADPWGQDRVA